METFRFLLCVSLIFVSIHASLSALNALQKRCLPPTENVVRRLFGHVMDILGIPRPKPPWWARLCPLASAVDRNFSFPTNTSYDLQAALDVLVCYLLPTLGLLIGLNRGHKPAGLQHGTFHEDTISGHTDIGPPRSPRLEKVDKAEEEIYTKCEPDLFTSTCRQLISGPVGKFFDFIKVLISSSLATLSIPESDVSWSYDRDGRGNPTLMVAQTTDFRVRVICGPFGLDIEVCHLGREVGRAGGNVYRKLEFRLYQATYLGIRKVKEGQMIVYGSGWSAG